MRPRENGAPETRRRRSGAPARAGAVPWVLAAGILGCIVFTGIVPDAAARGASVGTFRAVLDGRERAWFAVAGTKDGEPISSATWLRLPSTGRLMASLAGVDDAEAPVETFDLDLTQGKASTGDYHGSLLLVGFPFQEDDLEHTYPVPGSPGASVLYVPQLPEGRLDFGSAYVLSEGTLDVTRIQIGEDGTAGFTGTFSGTLRTMDGHASMTVEEGRFDVTEARRVEAAGPPGTSRRASVHHSRSREEAP